MKRFLTTLTLALVLLPAQVSSSVICPGVDSPLRPLGYQQLSVGGTAVGFTLPTTATVRIAVVMVEDASIRYRDDGTDPTAAIGTLVTANTGIVVCGPAAATFKAIQVTTAANLSIHFYGD